MIPVNNEKKLSVHEINHVEGTFFVFVESDSKEPIYIRIEKGIDYATYVLVEGKNGKEYIIATSNFIFRTVNYMNNLLTLYLSSK